MPGSARVLSVAAAREHIGQVCLGPSDARLVGVETEWHVSRHGDPAAIVPIHELRAATRPLLPLPGGSAITFEPGGQIELSSAPSDGVSAACEAASLDLALVRDHLSAHGIVLAAHGVDPCRAPARQLRAPRYDAMESYFDAHGPHGRVMMTRTAAVQANVDNGSAASMSSRWRTLHAAGPTLVAMFANSPIACGAPTGWRSTRLANWWAMDASRTHPVGDGMHPDAWCDYALDANVMLVRASAERFVPLRSSLTMRAWIDNGHPLGYPTLDDLDYHLTTLFPPVRPRGWFEVRYLDALPDPWWRAAVAVVSALTDEADAGTAACDAVARHELAGRWLHAARAGLDDPALAACAAHVLRIATDALDGAAPALADLCRAYADRFVARHRTPADDALDQWFMRHARQSLEVSA